MWVLYVVALAAFFWYFFVAKRPKNMPPGPWFRFPVIGIATQGRVYVPTIHQSKMPTSC